MGFAAFGLSFRKDYSIAYYFGKLAVNLSDIQYITPSLPPLPPNLYRVLPFSFTLNDFFVHPVYIIIHINSVMQ